MSTTATKAAQPPNRELDDFMDFIGTDETGGKKEEQQEEKPDDKKEDPPKKKEEKELEEIKENDDPFAEGRKKKPTKDESVATIKKQRDDEREKNKIYTETFKDLDPKVIQGIVEYVVDQAGGPVTPEVVKGLVESFQSSNKTVAELQEVLKKKEEQLAELDISYSDDYRENFIKPLEQAGETLLLEFAQVSGGNIIGPKATKTLHDFLLKTPEATSLQIKEQIQKFVKDYKTESGEDPVVPSLSGIMGSFREFNQARAKAEAAKSDWSNTKARTKQQKEIEALAEKEAKAKLSERDRKTMASKAYREFDTGDLDIEDKEIQDTFREEFQFTDKILKGEDAPPFDELLARGAKSRLWDKYLPELVELRKLKKELEASGRAGIRGSDRGSSSSVKDADWMKD